MGARFHTVLEAVDNADTYVVVVLTASPGIHVQVGSSGVEIARFDPSTPAVPRPHIQSSSELDYAGIGATWPRVRSAKNKTRGVPESPVAAARANPRGDALARKKVHAQGWSHEQRRDVLGNLVLVGVQVHMIEDPYGQFRIESENLLALEQACVIHIEAHPVSEMNVGIGVVRNRILDRLGADESSPRRDGNLIYGCPTTEVLRPNAANENQDWHTRTARPLAAISPPEY